jgi:hypothetical protein
MLAKWFRDEIEVCRPGSRDIDEPEMSQLSDALAHDPAVRRNYEFVQQLDARVAEAFGSVPIPAGLAARLLTAVGRAQEAATSINRLAEPVAGLPLALGRRRWMSRRRLVVALAASIVLGAGLWRLTSPANPAGGEVTSEATRWCGQLADVWQPLAEAPADLALPPSIVGTTGGWQAVPKGIARHGVAYRLTQGAGGAGARGGEARAVLFVLWGKRGGLPPSAPHDPQSSTGGVSIGAWQSQGLVYVLVVEGDQRAYRRFLRPGRQPLA